MPADQLSISPTVHLQGLSLFPKDCGGIKKPHHTAAPDLSNTLQFQHQAGFVSLGSAGWPVTQFPADLKELKGGSQRNAKAWERARNRNGGAELGSFPGAQLSIMASEPALPKGTQSCAPFILRHFAPSLLFVPISTFFLGQNSIVALQ